MHHLSYDTGMSPMTIVRHLSPPLPCHPCLRDRSEHCVHGLARHRLTRHRASGCNLCFFQKVSFFLGLEKCMKFSARGLHSWARNPPASSLRWPPERLDVGWWVPGCQAHAATALRKRQIFVFPEKRVESKASLKHFGLCHRCKPGSQT